MQFAHYNLAKSSFSIRPFKDVSLSYWCYKLHHTGKLETHFFSSQENRGSVTESHKVSPQFSLFSSSTFSLSDVSRTHSFLFLLNPLPFHTPGSYLTFSYFEKPFVFSSRAGQAIWSKYMQCIWPLLFLNYLQMDIDFYWSVCLHLLNELHENIFQMLHSTYKRFE